MKVYSNKALAKSTKSTYKQAKRIYKKFCKLVHIECRPRLIQPPDRHVMLLFVAYLASNRRLSYVSLRPYIYGIRRWWLDAGVADPTKVKGKKWHKFESLCAGIKRSTCRRKKIRKPLTLKHIKSIICEIPHMNMTANNTLVFKAEVLVAFFGFLRCSEYTMTPSNKALNLRYKDVKICPNKRKYGLLRLTLQKTKTDQYASTKIRLWGNGKDHCPVKAMRAYLDSTYLQKDSPLFIYSDITLSAKKFNQVLKAVLKRIGLCENFYSSHSLRSGTASTAASRGVPTWLIKKLGRWRSDCFKIYIPNPKRSLSRAQRSMAK